MLTDGQALALTALESGPCRRVRGMSMPGEVNVRAVRVLVDHGFARVEPTLLGERFVMTDAGRQALDEACEHERQRRRLHTTHKISRRGMQPLGSLCQHCHYRPARPNRRYPNMATNYCSDTCRQADSHAERDDLARQLADEIRAALGLPVGRGKHFTVPELRAIRRRVVESKRKRKRPSNYGVARKRAS